MKKTLGHGDGATRGCLAERRPSQRLHSRVRVFLLILDPGLYSLHPTPHTLHPKYSADNLDECDLSRKSPAGIPFLALLIFLFGTG
jgi:hypothetical protein